MSYLKQRIVWVGALAGLLAMPAAQAQFAVIDAASIAQLVRQLATMEQQLTTLKNQLSEAQAQYAALTGTRGMQNLLSGVNRNYLPPDWPTLMGAASGTSSAYPALTAGVQGNVSANAVLTGAQIASLSSADQSQLTSNRQNAALAEATVQQALETTSSRFADLQQLIAAIGSASDTKASLDLAARIGAEEAMVSNDQTKLQLLSEAAATQMQIQEERDREQAIAGIGSLRDLPAMGL